MPSSEFGSKSAATAIRKNPAVKPHLAPQDDARTLTVVLKPDTPASIVERVQNRAFETLKTDQPRTGMAGLSESERKSLRRQHSTFSWNDHGFEAMQVKGAMQAKGVTEWQDYYDPGEGTGGALKKLEASMQQSARTGAGLGIGGDYVDDDPDMGARARQAERALSGRLDGAKEAALLQRDLEAQTFVREEAMFESDGVWDVYFQDNAVTGTDYDRLREVHESRSRQAQVADEARKAPVTTDPIEWVNNPSRVDYPTIDTPPSPQLEDGTGGELDGLSLEPGTLERLD